MADEILYCARLEDCSGDFDLAAEMLSALELEFSSYFDREQQRVYHTVYAPDAATAAENLERLKQAIAEWSDFGVAIGEIESFTLAKADWAEAWKKYFKAIPVSERLLVMPSWLTGEPLPGQKVLTLDPGMSFGTGQHATTLFCLRQIDRLAERGGSLLDAGCGSGILAIAGALLGYGPIDAFDFDPDAVRVAQENLALNAVTSVSPTVGDAANYPGRPEKYDLVCANILGHLLKAYRHNIAGWVKPGGHLALAGILATEFDGVASAFVELGFEELDRVTQREWTGGLFRRR